MRQTRSSARDILSLTENAPDIFLSGLGELNHIGTVFGGRMLAQALASATRTVDAMPVTSVHAYFIAPASAAVPIEYRVERLRDSRRFANRYVTARQGDQLVFVLMCQFHAPEDSFTHQAADMPDVPPPEEVPLLQDFIRENKDRLDFAAIRNFSGALPIEMRTVNPEAYFLERPEKPLRAFWFRLPSAKEIDDPREHAWSARLCQ